MSTQEIKTYWLKATSSGGRREDDQYYRGKAAEHAALMSLEDRAAGCVDLACGSGELLFHFMDLANVKVGVDYSESMLQRAAGILAGKNIILLNKNIFDYLPGSDCSVWTTTGGLNQYLDQSDMNAFLDVFAANQAACSLYLFDCIDHLRYSMIGCGSSYLAATPRKWKTRLFEMAYRSWVALELALGWLGKPCRKNYGVSMGYGYLPRFWHRAAAARGLRIEIVSSQQFEYRYHVVLRKMPGR